MKTLQRSFARFDDWFVSSTGLRFRGSTQTAKEGISAISNFLETRLVLHVRSEELAQPGMVVVDARGRRFLLAEHDRSSHTRVLKMFPVTTFASWKRETQTTESVTGLPMGSGLQDLGGVWCAIELYGREEIDRQTHIGMDRSRVLTGSDVRLNDLIEGRMVRRLNTVYGIKVLEIQ